MMPFLKCIAVVVIAIPLFAQLITAQEKAPPNPGKTDQPRQSSRDAKDNRQPDKPPTTHPKAVQKPQATPTSEQISGKIASEDKGQAIRIIAVPRVSVQAVKDWTDHSIWIAYLLLVVVGAAANVVAFMTLRVVRRQTDAIQQQTIAIVEGQRPKIAASPHGDALQTLQDPLAPRVEIELTNVGPSAASAFTYETWIEILALPFNDFTSSVDHPAVTDEIVLYPNIPLVLSIHIMHGITPEQMKALRAGHLNVCVRIDVKYKDAFKPRRSVSFGFIVHPNGLGYLPKYNWDH